MSTSSVNNEPTNGEILEAINSFAGKVEERFDGIEKRFDGIEKRLNNIESTIVTKDYLDEKLAALRGDTVSLVHKEDEKVNAIVKALDDHDVLPKQGIASIKRLNVFPAPPALS